MHFTTPRLAALAVLLGVGLAACGSTSEPSIPVSGQLVGQSAGSPGHVVLSALGAQRIGVRTSVARAVPAPPPIVTTTVVHGVKTTTSTPAPKPAAAVIIPYSAVIYDPSGKTYAFTNTAPLTFIEVPITVDHISGTSAYLSTGPKAGAKVVSVGAEELYGVQTGVLAQT
ncbi:MAG: hypothetical protein ACXVFQ_26100 [Solirubrobacteraceae bacterium]